ncbi:MAG: AI-2E family transporter [Desulfobulbaceae bacterium]|nr:AI-2E family transporter [Desulfobulbaceae bacterium]
MNVETLHKTVLLALVVAISLLFLGMIQQFLMPLFMAGLFSAIFSAPHHWLSQKMGGRDNLAALLVVLAIVILLLVPIGFLIGIVVTQAIHVSESVTPWVQAFLREPTTVTKHLQSLPYYEQILPYRDIIVTKAGELVGVMSTFLINSLSSVTKMTINAIIGSILMLYIMFYFLNIGDVLLKRILYLLPLEDEDELLILHRFTSVTRATIKGTVIIGVLQGAVCGLAFALAGIEGPVFWGTVMAVMSIIPAIGAALVWAPALIILALTGDISGVVILVALCGLVAGNLDNVLRPRLVGKDTAMHDLFVLFGTLGGIAMFGILGIIVGPIVAALFITIWEIYGKAFHEYLPEVKTVLLAHRQRIIVDESTADQDEPPSERREEQT